MIESATGQILLPFAGLRIGPELTREQFLASAAGRECRTVVQNEPYCSFALPLVSQGGHDFACSVWFYGSVLQRVSISCADREFGSSWADWSEERENARREFHDAWLDSVLGPGWRKAHFSWGTVSSSYDPKGGFSSISVRYAG